MTYKILARVPKSIFQRRSIFFLLCLVSSVPSGFVWSTQRAQMCLKFVQSERPSVSNNWIRNASVSGFVRHEISADSQTQMYLDSLKSHEVTGGRNPEMRVSEERLCMMRWRILITFSICSISGRSRSWKHSPLDHVHSTYQNLKIRGMTSCSCTRTHHMYNTWLNACTDNIRNCQDWRWKFYNTQRARRL